MLCGPRQVQRFACLCGARARARVCVGGRVGGEESRGLRLKEGGKDIEWEKREGEKDGDGERDGLQVVAEREEQYGG